MISSRRRPAPASTALRPGFAGGFPGARPRAVARTMAEATPSLRVQLRNGSETLLDHKAENSYYPAHDGKSLRGNISSWRPLGRDCPDSLLRWREILPLCLIPGRASWNAGGGPGSLRPREAQNPVPVTPGSGAMPAPALSVLAPCPPRPGQWLVPPNRRPGSESGAQTGSWCRKKEGRGREGKENKTPFLLKGRINRNHGNIKKSIKNFFNMWK